MPIIEVVERFVKSPFKQRVIIFAPDMEGARSVWLDVENEIYRYLDLRDFQVMPPSMKVRRISLNPQHMDDCTISVNTWGDESSSFVKGFFDYRLTIVLHEGLPEEAFVTAKSVLITPESKLVVYNE